MAVSAGIMGGLEMTPTTTGGYRAHIFALAVATLLLAPGRAHAFAVAVGGLPQQAEYGEADYSGPDAGYVVLSIGLHDADVGMRNIILDSEKDDGRTLAAFALKTGIWAPGRNDFNKDGIEANVIVRALPPGNYALTRFVGTVGANCNYPGMRADFRVPFSVKPGKVSYLGDFRYEPLIWNTIFGAACSAGGYFVVTDESARDLAIAKTKQAALPETADIQIPDLKALDLPMFQPGLLPQPQPSPTGLHSRSAMNDVRDMMRNDRKNAREKITALLQSGDVSQTEMGYLHSWLGAIDADNRDEKGAMAEFTEAVRLNPLLSAAWGDRSSIRFRQGDNDGAFDDMKMAVRLSPHYPTWYMGLGDIEIARGHTDLAMIAYDDAITMAPDSPEPYIRRAYGNMKIGRFDIAIADIDRGTKAKGSPQAQFLALRCAAGVRAGHADALTDCDSALKLDPKNIAALYICGFAHLTAGQTASAIENFDAALAIKPAEDHALFGRGLAKQKSGDEAGGKADIDAAHQIDPNIANIARYYGLSEDGSQNAPKSP